MMDAHEARELAMSMLSAKRFHHSECVAQCAVRLAPGFGADPEKALIAGLLHDVMKEQEDSVLLKWMGGSAIIGDTDYSDLHALWHAYAGAGFVKGQLGLDDETADAIRFHTSGRTDMSPLEKTIFLADYISEDRTFESAVRVRKVAETDQDKACLEALRDMICHLVSEGRILDLNSPAAYDWFVRMISQRETK